MKTMGALALPVSSPPPSVISSALAACMHRRGCPRSWQPPLVSGRRMSASSPRIRVTRRLLLVRQLTDWPVVPVLAPEPPVATVRFPRAWRAWTLDRFRRLIKAAQQELTGDRGGSWSPCAGRGRDGSSDFQRGAQGFRRGPRSLGPCLALGPGGECAHARLFGVRNPDGASAAVLGQGGQRSHAGALRAAH